MYARIVLLAALTALLAVPATQAQLPLGPDYSVSLEAPRIGFRALHPGDSETWTATVKQHCSLPVARYQATQLDVSFSLPDGFAVDSPKAVKFGPRICDPTRPAETAQRFDFKVTVLPDAKKASTYGILQLQPHSALAGVYDDGDALYQRFSLRSAPEPSAPRGDGSQVSGPLPAASLVGLGLLGPLALALRRD